jgi:hypothetical protein
LGFHLPVLPATICSLFKAMISSVMCCDPIFGVRSDKVKGDLSFCDTKIFSKYIPSLQKK